MKLNSEEAQLMGEWTDMHPLRYIPNWPSVPLFTTTDEARLQRVLDWAREHPGQLVPDDVLDLARADENELERASLRVLVHAGLLDTAPHIVWTFHATGLMPTQENFDDMPDEDQGACEAAWAQWDAMSEADRADFAQRMQAFVATLPA